MADPAACPRRHHALLLLTLAAVSLILLYMTPVRGHEALPVDGDDVPPPITHVTNSRIPAHARCGFDELEARTIGTRVSGISRIVRPALTQRNIDAEAAPAADNAAWEPIRIRVFTEDLNNARRYCFASGQPRPNFQGGTVTCTSDDVLTNGKKTVLTDFLVPSAIKLHEDRLNVQRVNGNIVVEASIASDPICGQFTIPAAHITTGVSDADFVLYLSAGPTESDVIAWATTCQYLDDNGRPSVGVSNVSPKYISADPQTVRVITHEILHALGFAATTFLSQAMFSMLPLRGKARQPLLISPNVVAKARAQYGCATQTFMELEDEGGAGTAYSHWKRRSAKDELMAGISGVGHYTALTIAAMEDTGFYKGNYTNAEPMSYGQNAGCALTTTKCVANGVSQFAAMFCATTSNAMTCTSDHMALGTCFVGQYPSALAPYFQYFSNPTIGGGDSLMDYCPYTQEYSNTKCSMETDALLGHAYGVNARCFNVPTGFVSEGYILKSQLAVCADVQCGTSTYGVKVAGASSYTACTPGATLSLPSLSSTFSSGSLTCPDYDDVCTGQVDAATYLKYGAVGADNSAAVTRTSAARSVVAAYLAALCSTVILLLA